MMETSIIIGITGNIATGKSVVRRMLANAGALGLDADLIAHRMIYPQGPAFQDVVSAFGKKILDQKGEIDRSQLGEIVFKDPKKLETLEAIVHPAVAEAVQKRLQDCHSPLAALEAIKLLEAGLGAICDAVWVSHAPRQVQMERLRENRGLSAKAALSRLEAQTPQEEKLARADVVINTNGPFQRTWEQVCQGLNDTIQSKGAKYPGSLAFSRAAAGPSAAQLPPKELLGFWQSQTGENAPSLYEALGAQMLQPLVWEGSLSALLTWENWNFTATLTGALPAETLLSAPPIALDAFQEAARRQDAELLLLPNELAREYDLKPASLGFNRCQPDELPYPAWRIAAQRIIKPKKEPVWARILAKPLEAERDYQLK